MNNQELLQKMKEDMKMRVFSHWTKESYELKAKNVIRFIYEVTMDKLINKKQLPMYRKRRKIHYLFLCNLQATNILCTRFL